MLSSSVRASPLLRFGLAPLLLAGCSAAAPTQPPAPAARFAAVDRLLDSAAVSIGLTDYSLVVLRGDSVVYERSRGAIGPNTAIPIASATKWLSGAVVMSLVADGTLSLDDSVGRYLAQAPAAKRGITLRQLFSHTSGLPASALCLSNQATTLAACAEQILALPLQSAPGASFVYGGASMQLAGRIAEVASGRSWGTLFDERLRQPLGLTLTETPGTNPRVAGGARSTRDEYARVLRMLLSGGTWQGRRVLAEAAVRELELDQTRGAAIGYTPHPDTRRYGIGVWRDRAGPQGQALQLSSQGAFGFSPWIDRERGVVGVLAVQERMVEVYGFVDELQRRVREAVDTPR